MTKIINIIRTILDKNKHCGESIGDEKVMDADSTVEGIAYNSTTSERANSWNNVLLVTESTQNEEANKKTPFVQNDNQNPNIKDNIDSNASVELNFVTNVDSNKSDNNLGSGNIEPNALNGNCELERIAVRSSQGI